MPASLSETAAFNEANTKDIHLDSFPNAVFIGVQSSLNCGKTGESTALGNSDSWPIQLPAAAKFRAQLSASLNLAIQVRPAALLHCIKQFVFLAVFKIMMPNTFRSGDTYLPMRTDGYPVFDMFCDAVTIGSQRQLTCIRPCSFGANENRAIIARLSTGGRRYSNNMLYGWIIHEREERRRGKTSHNRDPGALDACEVVLDTVEEKNKDPIKYDGPGSNRTSFYTSKLEWNTIEYRYASYPRD
ncbi:hypothetical protein K438DRAFT_1768024 [Mycena galopus ATCC 62051]|nr:hypothetical protein K438DRAFT_1768024 [Mycena galopus ATCC 62051]